MYLKKNITVTFLWTTLKKSVKFRWIRIVGKTFLIHSPTIILFQRAKLFYDQKIVQTWVTVSVSIVDSWVTSSIYGSFLQCFRILEIIPELFYTMLYLTVFSQFKSSTRLKNLGPVDDLKKIGIFGKSFPGTTFIYLYHISILDYTLECNPSWRCFGPGTYITE